MSSSSPTIILGAGLAGLSAAYHLECAYEIYEASPHIGGAAGSFQSKGFTFDHAIHVLFTKDPYVSTLFRKLLGDNFAEQTRSSWIYSHGVHTPYPYQANLYGLPERVIQENLDGLRKASMAQHEAPVQNFEEWIVRTFGEGIAKNFMIPFNRKVWATEPREMSYEWIAGRVIQPKLADVFAGAHNPATKDYGPNAQFWYPRYGGTAALPEAFGRHVDPAQVSLPCVAIDTGNHIATFQNGMKRQYEQLISTIPLPKLVRTLGFTPPEVTHATSLLKSNRVLTINLGVDREGVSDKHWIYYPDEHIPFQRASFPANFSAALVPKEKSSIMLEISESSVRPVDRRTIAARCVRSLIEIGILREDDKILTCETFEIDPAYIIYDNNHRSACDTVLEYLRSKEIHSCGRFGEWEYYNMDHTVLSGKRAAERVNAVCKKVRPAKTHQGA